MKDKYPDPEPVDPEVLRQQELEKMGLDEIDALLDEEEVRCSEL